MIKLYSPRDKIELALIKSILESEDIPYFVHNDHYGSLTIGPQIALFNAKTIMVSPEHEKTAKELLADFLSKTETEPEPTTTGYPLADKIRNITETLLFWWFMPGRRRKK